MPFLKNINKQKLDPNITRVYYMDFLDIYNDVYEDHGKNTTTLKNRAFLQLKCA